MRRWLFHVGGLGLVPLGFLDNSLLPLPCTADVATIALSARHEPLWIYYALMATTGSVIGGFFTYRIGFHGGKEALERRFSRRKVDRVCKLFGRWGFGAIFIPALLPPPVPAVPFLFAAGAMQYPAKKFLVALTLGRVFRFMILAYLAARYGRQFLMFIADHGHPVIMGIVMLLLTAGAAVLYFWRGSKSKRRAWRLSKPLF